jgi:L-lysine exporter family protein LysE/ArgO
MIGGLGLNVFLRYILLGLSLSAPIGPINAAQLDRGIRYGFLHAWLVGLGALAADVLYMILVYFGVVHFLNTPFMKTFLWLFGFFILVYTGVESLINAGKIQYGGRRSSETPLRAFLSGFFMSLSNPLTILFWLGIYGSVLAETAATYHTHDLVLYSGAIVFGILLWDFTMAGVASSFRRLLTDRVLTVISMISGLSLIGFGLYFGSEAFKALFL